MRHSNRNLYWFFIFYFMVALHPIISQNNTDVSKIVYKDFSQIDLEDLNNEGAVGVLLMKGHLATSLDSTLNYMHKALDLSAKTKDSLLKPYILYHLGYTNFNLQKFETAKTFFNECIKISKPYKLYGMLYECYNLLGVIEKYNNNFDTALAFFRKAMESTDIELDIIRIKINLATIYIDTKKFEFAELIIKEVFEFEKSHPNKIGNYWLTFAYINASYLQDNFKNELLMMQKATNYAALSKDAILNIQTKFNLAEVLVSNKSFIPKGLKELNSVIIASKKMKLYDILHRAYITKSKIYNLQGYYKASLQLLDSIDSDQALKLQSEINKLKYLNFKSSNDYENAIIYADSIINFLSITNKLEKQKASLEFAKKYKTEKKIQENELLKKDNLIKDLEVKKQTTNRNYLLLFSALGLIILGITYNRFRLKRKTANALATQNTIINNQKVELEKSNANKQRLFGIIAHDLVNPFNAILGYTKLLEEDYDSFKEDDRKQFISIINKYATSNYNLTKTLLDWAKIQQDRLVVNKATLNCKEIVAIAIQPYQVLADKKQIQITTNIPENTFVEADKNMMQTVIGNLFVNAIKFTPKNGEIKFHLEKNKDGTINIEIEDNGIGMSQEQLNNLFDITKVNTTQGTSNEKGNGLGLILSKELMELQKGTLQMFSKKDIGSRAVLTI